MKSFKVFALVFIGCQANVMWQDQANLSMEMVKDAFWDYVTKATQTTEDILQKIKESEMGQKINAKISESADAISKYTVAIPDQVTPLTQELLAKMSQEAKQLKAHQDFQKNMAPFFQSFQSQLVQSSQEMQQKLYPYTQDQKAQLTALWEAFEN